ncbi:unnamed protein product [Adineta ricciae]|uniref:Uncharacterized protein n=1 Tax=Adineta ricciae TaxID=249248 RepID=A0A813QFP0_ADIRI|nr:unnamed protein product [Adineta ricciae]
MTTISNNDDKESTLVVHFDRDWKYLRLTNIQTNEEFISENYNDQSWESIDLPHRDTAKTSCPVWYRKKFEWRNKPDYQQHIYLHFNPIENGNDDESEENKIPSATVWLNEKKSYSGTLSKPIELTNDLRIDADNILVIYLTEGHTLSLNARICMPRVCVGQVNYDDVDESTSKSRRQLLDYTASFNDADGLINVFIDSLRHKNKDILKSTFHANEDGVCERATGTGRSTIKTELETGPVPRVAILMLIVGTRGDVQPFIALAKALLACGHRVRLATHETFRKFVRENGIEFYPLAGDPADLMSFMVKNAGIVPSVSSIVAGDVAKSRRVIAEILASTWKACVENDDETDVPFIAEAIIANPPSYGHIHCAQKLQIPLRMIFTMPWSPTTQFSHPFIKVDYEVVPKDTINVLSYDILETLTWTGMRDLINEFRKDVLGLSPLHTRQAVRLLIDERVPFTYCWSPSLVPKPADWPDYIDISGFFFLDLATNYKPPEDLMEFLEKGDPPIYIGFGSITGHDPRRILKIILKALDATGYRAIISGLAKEGENLRENVFVIGNCPHDWLFQHVSAVCHHGGAGTTAAGLRAGKPTIIVPFFGDQFFWGNMINKSGAGPQPIPGKRLNSRDLIEAFKIAHEPGTRTAANELRVAFENENGCAAAVQSFHAHLPLSKMRSDLEPSFAACFRLNEYDLQISRPVAQVLISAGAIKESDLTPLATRDWYAATYDGRPHLPIHGLMKHGHKAFTSLFIDTVQGLRRAAGSNSLTTGTLDGAESIVKGVGKSIGHVYIGCLSFYGEITDALECLPKLYDPYSDSDKRKRPQVADFNSGARAAEHSIWHGFKDGVTGLVNKPRTGYERHGVLGGAAGAAVAIPNVIIKPVVGTLASLTWLGRGIYAEAKHLSHHRNSNSDDRLSVFTPGHRRSSSGSSVTTNESSPEGQASLLSGLQVKVCKQILTEFERIKYDRNTRSSSSSVNEQENSKETKKRHKLKKHLLQRQRSHSATPH